MKSPLPVFSQRSEAHRTIESTVRSSSHAAALLDGRLAYPAGIFRTVSHRGVCDGDNQQNELFCGLQVREW